MQKSQNGKPSPPGQDFPKMLDIEDSEYKDELVKDKVPESVFEMLSLRNTKLAEDEMLDQFSGQYQHAIGRVHEDPDTPSLLSQDMENALG